ERFLRARKSTLDHAPPETGILLANRRTRCAADRRARLARDHDGFPSRRRRPALTADDLDLVAGHQLRNERRYFAIDLAANGAVSHVGVHRIGEIDRRRLARKRDQPALRRETE